MIKHAVPRFSFPFFFFFVQIQIRFIIVSHAKPNLIINI